MAFASWDRFPDRKSRRSRFPTWPPTCAVEVLSESNTRPEMKRKRGEYFAAGVRLIWEFDPEATHGRGLHSRRSGHRAEGFPEARRRRCPAGIQLRADGTVRGTGPARLIHRRGDVRSNPTRNETECPSLRHLAAVPARSRSCPRSRREFLKVAGCGFGLLGLADLLARETRAADARRPAGAPGPATCRPRPSGASSCS